MPTITFESLSLGSAVIAALGFAGSFVLSLYLADVGLPRNHPTTVRRRIIAVTLVTVISPFILSLIADPVPDIASILNTLGLRWKGILPAIVMPIGLILVLYAGPLIQLATSSGIFAHLKDERKDVMLRNYIIAPIAEEIVFRSCIVPLFLPHLGANKSILITPLFFGIAHVHHMLEHLRMKTTLNSQIILDVILNTVVQTTYTSIFGMFSAYLFIRTGHVISPIIAHVLCNMLGLPEVWMINQHKYRIIVGITYFSGLALFIYWLPTVTDPTLFN